MSQRRACQRHRIRATRPTGSAKYSCSRSPSNSNSTKTIANVPNASPVAWATRAYSVAPVPRMADARVLKRLRVSIQNTAVPTEIRATSQVSAASRSGVVNSSGTTVATMHAREMTVASITRRRMR